MHNGKTNNQVYSGIETHLQELKRYARSLAGANGADDLLQDCVERALSRSHLFREGTNLRAWLFTIMRNLFVSETRRVKRAGPVIDPEIACATMSVSPSQEHAVLLNEMDRAMPSLPAGQREAIQLVAVSGFAYEEAAALMETGIGTVRSRLSRGRSALRRFGGSDEEKTSKEAA